ncbi:VWA domain-containing protein [Mycobacterium sp. 236(2023)]|uniref:VWA domain-containing protein n=1 Tax=Mycobacterium sp. 236(2023) TaxID=3038163 RepID=UPI00241523CF|nr:VWA domain-containing protein [Mycobacterium sp. 236(2023)]MDG4667091.1 VWA domain-containing protein [Mycobacterium sp. 236(2023)]
MTLAQFDTEYELLYPSTDIGGVPEFVLAPRGMTALLDSAGRFITEVGERLSALPEEDRPGQVICMTMTDGMENSSTEWSWESVRDLINQQRDQWNWKFIFLGSNIDAVEVGARMGVAADDAITYNDGLYMSTVAVSAAASSWIGAARAGKPAGFTDAERAAAMGT